MVGQGGGEGREAHRLNRTCIPVSGSLQTLTVQFAFIKVGVYNPDELLIGGCASTGSRKMGIWENEALVDISEK